MKIGDLVRRHGYKIYLYKDIDLKIPASVVLNEGDIGTIVQIQPAKVTMRGKLISPEKVRIMLSSGLCFWADSNHFSLVQSIK